MPIFLFEATERWLICVAFKFLANRYLFVSNLSPAHVAAEDFVEPEVWEEPSEESWDDFSTWDESGDFESAEEDEDWGNQESWGEEAESAPEEWADEFWGNNDQMEEWGDDADQESAAESTSDDAWGPDYEEESTDSEVEMVALMSLGDVAEEQTLPESSHPYANRMDETWTYSVEGAEAISVTFDSQTKVESNYDYIYVYSGDDSLQGKYTGTTLAGKTLKMLGNIVKVRLTSNGSGTAYGFKITAAQAIEVGQEPELCFAADTKELPVGVQDIKHQLITCETDGILTYESSDTNVAAVDSSTGAITAVGEGTTTITVYSAETTLYKAGSASFTLNVTNQGTIIDSGSCGNNLIWYLTEEDNDRVLRITGNGPMTADLYYSPFRSKSATIVVIEEGVTSIGGCAFSDCRSLTSVSIPDSVTSIGVSAFEGCDSLTSVTIPDGVTSIGYFAFDGCSSLTSVTIGKGVKSIEDCAFSGCNLKAVNVASISSWLNINAAEPVCSERFYIDGLCLSEVIIPEGTKCIRDYAFDGWNQLTTVSIPDSVTSIGWSAFEDCDSLTSVTIPDSVTSIGDFAFEDCVSLTSVTIGKGVTSIGGGAFSGCSNLKSVSIPDSVTSIDGGAFSGCSNLTTVSIPNSVTSIGKDAFYHCSKLYSVYLQDPIKFAGVKFGNSDADPRYYATNVFIGNSTETQDYEIEAGLTEIPNKAFYRVRNLRSVSIPNSVTSIASSAFRECSKLASVSIPNGVKEICPYTFYKCSSLTSVSIPSSVTEIGFCAFYSCSKLKSVTIPEKLTSIGDKAFYGISIKCYIPKSVTYFGSNIISKTATLVSCCNKDAELYAKNNGMAFKKEHIFEKVTDAGTGVVKRKCALCGEISDIVSPNMKFKSSSVKKIYGNAAFTNPLTYDTDAKIMYSSSKTSVATVDSATGKVTIKGVGTTTIKAAAPETVSYMAGSVSYTLTVSKAENTITASNITKTYSTKSMTASIGATCKDSAKMTYSSNNTNVKVSSTGTITIAAKFIGKATITIKAAATTKYNAATKTITVTVNPTATKITSMAAASSTTLKLGWKAASAGTGYQIQYAKNADMTSSLVTKTVSSLSTTSLTTGTLATNTIYYFRIRTYKTVGSTKYYSAWSKQWSACV